MRAREFDPESVSSILVMRLYFLGDVLLSTPVFEALKRRFPRAPLSVLIKRRARDILINNPFVDEVLEYDAGGRNHGPAWRARLAVDLRRRRFGLAVDLTGDLRTSWLLFAADPGFRIGVNHAGLGFLLDRRTPYRAEGHVVDHLLRVVEPVGARLDTAVPALYLTEEERASAAGLLERVGVKPGRRFVLLSPGANWPPRRWPPDRFGALARSVRERMGFVPVVAGGADETRLADEVVSRSGGSAVSLAGRTTIRELAAVAGLASAFVGNDSGPVHIAASQGTPVVALFGPNTPERFAPRGAPSRVLWARHPCSPCDQRRCLRPSDPCMEAITLDGVLEALESLLEDDARGGGRS